MARYLPYLLCPACVALSVTASGRAGAGEPPQPVLILVQAKVESMGARDPERGTPATLVVTHVYAGGGKVLGKSFVDWFLSEEGTGLGTTVPFRVGQEGIWSLTASKDQLVLERFPELPFIFRSRPEESVRHKQTAALAEVIERYYGLEPSERLPQAKGLVRSAVPEVSVWAVRTLDAHPGPPVTSFFEEEAKKREAPPAGLAALDQALVRRARREWVGSERRTSLLTSLATGDADEYSAHEVLAHLDALSQHDELSGRLATDLYRSAADNRKWRLQSRREAINYLGMFVRRSMNPAGTFTWLWKQVETNPEVELRRAAAAVIARALRLTDAERQLVTARLQKEEDKEVAAALRDAVNK